MKEDVRYQSCFVYKGVTYGKGTTVLFSDKVHQKYHFTTKLKKTPHQFIGGSNTGWMNFRWQEGDDWQYDAHSEVTVYDIEEEIAEIVNPVYAELIPWHKEAFNNMVEKKVQPDVFGGVLLYIIIMTVGTIFIDRWLIWIFSTIIFAVWLLNQYRV